MVKVITPIGAIVEVDEAIYEANKNILTPYSSEAKGEESSDKAMTDVENTAVKPKAKK